MLQDKLIGKRIRRFREIKGVSQKEMAHRLNMDPSNYSRIESGETRLTSERLQQIAEVLEVSSDVILDESHTGVYVQTANNSQIGSGENARFVQHVVSEQFVRELFDRFDKLLEHQTQVSEKLIDLVDRIQKSGANR